MLEEQDDCLLTVFRTKRQVTTTPRFVKAVLISNNPLKMEVDSGAVFSIISRAIFARVWPHDAPVFKERKLAWRTWSGECLGIMGFMLIDVSFKHSKAQLSLLMAGRVGASLLERIGSGKRKIAMHRFNSHT